MNAAIRKPWLLVSLLALFSAGCSDNPAAPSGITTLPRELSQAERAVIEANNHFAFDLLKEVNRDEGGANVFISPLSASMALGMTMNGAEGTTFEAMQSTLRFEGLEGGTSSFVVRLSSSATGTSLTGVTVTITVPVSVAPTPITPRARPGEVMDS